MGKKKRKFQTVEDVLARPWCYYCERDFDDLKILISHQKARHFKCDKCYRRLNTAGGLNVHMNQVHKETLSQVENALPNRKGLEVEIFGMEGVPEDVVQAHQQRILTEYYEKQKERQLKTGNPPAGSGKSVQPKKPRLETPAELKARLREWLAQKNAGQLGVNGNAMQIDSAPHMMGPPAALAAGTTHSPVPPLQGNMYPVQAGLPPVTPTQANPVVGAYASMYSTAQSLSPPNTMPFPPPYTAGTPGAMPPHPGYGVPAGPAGFMAPPSQAQNGLDPTLAASVDDLISSAAMAAQQKASTDTPAQEKAAEKKKKEKSNIQLIFSDSHTMNQEEEFAQLPRYAFSKG